MKPRPLQRFSLSINTIQFKNTTVALNTSINYKMFRATGPWSNEKAMRLHPSVALIFDWDSESVTNYRLATLLL